jgi:molybdopterin converting factor small subunit
MAVTIKLSPEFHRYADGLESVEVEGVTVRACLDCLIARYPVFRDLMSDSDHSLSALIIYDREVIVPVRLDRAVKDRGEISLMPMIYGG